MKSKHHHQGCDLAYTVEGSGPPVVFIQGVGVHGSGWLPQVRALADRFTCLTFDNRGIGESQPRPARLSVKQMADDTAALMDACGWDSAHVVGHSLGGLVSLQLALDNPRRVRSLSLLCTFANGAEATKLSLRMLWVGLRTRIGTRRQRRNAFLKLVLPPDHLASANRDALASELALLFGHDLADQSPIALTQLAAMRACDLTPRLAEIRGTPTLVVSASHDRIARPELGAAIGEAIPGARFCTFAHASHGLPIQFSAEVNEVLARHLYGRA
ncbi:MAG: alpha/beta hydrolase [Bryobacteraceae bacterium]|nr:alpha/beta hydrolase [Bryobacteraceae bacterium]